MPSFLGIQIKISAAPSHNGLICSKFDCDSDNFSVTLSLSIKIYLAMNFLHIYLVGKCASARSVMVVGSGSGGLLAHWWLVMVVAIVIVSDVMSQVPISTPTQTCIHKCGYRFHMGVGAGGL